MAISPIFGWCETLGHLPSHLGKDRTITINHRHRPWRSMPRMTRVVVRSARRGFMWPVFCSLDFCQETGSDIAEMLILLGLKIEIKDVFSWFSRLRCCMNMLYMFRLLFHIVSYIYIYVSYIYIYMSYIYICHIYICHIYVSYICVIYVYVSKGCSSFCSSFSPWESWRSWLQDCFVCAVWLGNGSWPSASCWPYRACCGSRALDSLQKVQNMSMDSVSGFKPWALFKSLVDE